MCRIGIAISGGPNPAEIIDLVVLAESLGYESAWVAEGHGGDQFAILAACAMRTSRIIPSLTDDHPYAQSRSPMDMMVHG
jgi:alkanesulfonate monooxygenase SsuD/methylene tetrahydromethanopterin reductase-like flavin-dependent oxidoreductase (luciferase family)